MTISSVTRTLVFLLVLTNLAWTNAYWHLWQVVAETEGRLDQAESYIHRTLEARQ